MNRTLLLRKARAALLTLTAAGMLLSGTALAADNTRTIPYPATYNTKVAGASPYIGQIDIADSPYYQAPDFFAMTSNDHLTILPRYKTYQQTTDVTCGPAAALTVLYHFGNTKHTELELAGIMDTKYKVGTATAGMVKFFESIGWKVDSSLQNAQFSDFDKFALFVNSTLKDNTPILVENVDWGGHWRAIIGYDTMGTTTLGDDVLIMADPFDTSDHKQDGYVIVPAEKFFYMWFDARTQPEKYRDQQWVVAHP